MTTGIFKMLSSNLLKSFIHRQYPCLTQAATYIKYPKDEVPSFHDIEMPEQRELPEIPRIPFYYINNKPPLLRKSHTIDLRGPERVHNRLFYKQYGIIALSAGYLLYQHTDIIAHTVNRELDKRRMFAIWRVDPLWKPITKSEALIIRHRQEIGDAGLPIFSELYAIGKRMGGGKPNVHHYASPVRAGRIVIEVGGRAEFKEVLPFLNRVAKKMPFDAMPVSQAILEEIEKEATDLYEKNINPFSFGHVVENDMQGCNMWTSPWDFVHHGDYI